MTAGYWARAQVDAERCLVYSPRLGRSYLLSSAESLAPPLQRVLGLAAFTLDDDLGDPADRILHDRSSVARLTPVPAPPGLRLLYRCLHWSRRVVPFVPMARRVAYVARRVQREPSSLTDIARIVHAVEEATGLADCYPRALLTCYLCLRSARTCQLSLGTLAPTRKMHAWCTADGELPYEALPEHYLYRPLLCLQFSSNQ